MTFEPQEDAKVKPTFSIDGERSDPGQCRHASAAPCTTYMPGRCPCNFNFMRVVRYLELRYVCGMLNFMHVVRYLELRYGIQRRLDI